MVNERSNLTGYKFRRIVEVRSNTGNEDWIADVTLEWSTQNPGFYRAAWNADAV